MSCSVYCSRAVASSVGLNTLNERAIGESVLKRINRSGNTSKYISGRQIRHSGVEHRVDGLVVRLESLIRRLGYRSSVMTLKLGYPTGTL